MSIPQYGVNQTVFCMPGQTKTASASMSISASMTITWVADPNKPNEPVPDTVNVVEQSQAVGTGDTWAADDGLGDAAVNGVSAGTHVMQLALTNGTGSWSRSFSASGSQTISNPSQPTYARAGGYLTSYNAWTIAPTVLGDSTVDSANWDETQPSFFSGTNCTAFASASAVTGYVTDMQLLIGGTVVDEYIDTPDHPQNPHQSSVSLSVVFDSSEFSDGTVVPIKTVVTDSGGNTYSGQITGPIYNRALVLGNNKTNGGVGAESHVYAQCWGADLNPTGSTMMVKTDILTGIPPATDFFTYSHGPDDNEANAGIQYFDDCTINTEDPTHIVYSSAGQDPNGVPGVADEVVAKTLTQPAYNFVDLCCCNDYDFGFAWQMTIDENSPGYKDRAIIGWIGSPEDDSVTINFSNDVWQCLANGQTLQSALDQTENVDLYQPKDINGNIVPENTIGDTSMTLHGTAYGAQPHQWYLVK